jgi:pimeloyl-ACP methyl ester carboxylesterase
VRHVLHEVIDTRGVALPVHRTGNGPEVVFVHGDDGLLFAAPLLGQLARHATVHAPVLPGWGELPRPEHITGVDDLAVVLLDLLDVLADDGRLEHGVVLVGVSVGAWVVAEALVRDQHRVRGALLVSPLGIKVRGPRDRDVLDLHAAPAAEVERAMYARSPVIDRACLTDAEMLELARAQDALTRYAWRPYLHDPKLRGRLGRVRVPVTIVHGELDRFVYDPHEFYGAYAGAFGGGTRLVPVPGAAHRVDEERPDVVADELARLLGEG